MKDEVGCLFREDLADDVWTTGTRTASVGYMKVLSYVGPFSFSVEWCFEKFLVEFDGNGFSFLTLSHPRVTSR